MGENFRNIKKGQEKNNLCFCKHPGSNTPLSTSMQKPEESLKGSSLSMSYLITAYGKNICKFKKKEAETLLHEWQVLFLNVSWNMDFYLVQEGVSPKSSHLAAIIQQSKVSLSCSVKFSDLNFPKSSHKVPPNICSDPVAYCKSDLVVFITEFLFEEKRRACVC